jgi:hypothetical protein
MRKAFRGILGPIAAVEFALMSAFGGALARADDLDDDQALTLEFPTPHTDWAQPYARGTVRLLYFTSIPFSGVDYCKPRHIVELMQRFDVRAEAAYWAQIADSPDYEWLGGARGQERIRRLLEQPFDVFFFDRVPLTHLTAEAQYKLLKAVSEGKGLILMGVDDERVLKPGNRFPQQPSFLAGAPVQDLFTVGRGRGVKMDLPPDTPYRVGWEVGYDYWQEGLGRAVLWAAHREPEVELAVQVEPSSLDRTALPREAVTVRCSSPDPARPLRFDVRLRRDDGQVVASLPTPRRGPANGPLRFQVPLVPAGSYHLDVRARSERGWEAWATAPFTVTSPRRIESLELDREWGEIGEQIRGRVTLAGEPLKGERLQVRLVDQRGRILVQREWASGSRPVRFRFPIAPWFPMLVRVEAVLLDPSPVASDDRFVRVVKRHHGQFNFLAWESPVGPLSDYVEEALARLGVTVQLVWRNPPLEAAAHEIAWVPYTTRILAPHDENGIMQPVCWNDEPAVEEYVQSIVAQYRPAREHGVFVYSLGDETVTRGACVHPACLAAYRRYLQQEYGTIAALNASWGTDFASFDAVELSRPRDNDEAEALRAKNYPRWYDRQAFQCYNFVQLCKRFGEAYRAMDPQARTGFEGAGSFNAGDDYDLIVRTNGFWSPYPGPGDEVIRSIAPRGFLHSNWMGYTKDADSLLAVYWRMILRGCDSVWWWMWPNVGRFNGLLRPTLAPYPAVQEIVKDTQVVRDGLGTLLIHSDMQDDGIALLYSMPSAYAVRLEAGSSYGNYEDHHVAWHHVLRELGLQFRYVTDRMLRQGEFDAGHFKVLILSRAEALGPAEAQAIRQFVEGGGTVIADLRPGLYDGHCKPLAEGLLDDLFGIRRRANAERVTGEATLEGSWLKGTPSLRFPAAICDPGLELAAGIAHGKVALEDREVPLAILRQVGRGQALLLNFAMTSYPSLAAPSPSGAQGAGSDAAADYLRAVLAGAGIKPALTLQGADGRRLRHVEAVRWRNGDIELLALFRPNGEAEEARVTLPVPRHIYNLRQRQHLAKTSAFTVPLVPCRATFLALTPQPVGLPKMTLPRTVRRGQQATARLMVWSGQGLHAVRIRAQTPEGQPAEWLDQVVLVGPAGGEVTLPFAYNDPVGKWTVRAMDLYTDQGTTATVVLQP